jgi:uncharacterized UBP type Zn finger protein
MITIKDFMETVDYRITEGSDFGWQCFGPNSHCIDCWNGNHEGFSIGIVFDTKNTTVYKFEAHDYAKENSYRWVHPDWREIYNNEAKNKNVDNSQAYDDVKYIDIDLSEDILEKARLIVMGIDYDERIQVPLELPDSLMNKLFRMAHDQDITLNELVENILREELNIT